VAFVLDNSISASWHFEDEVSAYAETVLSAFPREEALVPPIWAAELANSLLVGERRGRISAARVAQAVESTLALPILISETTTTVVLTTVLALARQYRLTAYDAAYLELAMREGIPLATQDNDLRGAAERAGVPIFDLA
jgi:predicted nucleic acid-binding protein